MKLSPSFVYVKPERIDGAIALIETALMFGKRNGLH
jgi:hypothetical protein